ncbi:hypothetical protein Pflav_019260 [Phytohabitans flavus]|uniref:tRNA synthetases class I catalytic domain-containing protein n=1 Tax=Phytohabitans flavus TaxID=1076124 RepID=A0A6F8XNX2_9ACTN|nr:hypothetical protein Pflav_019260 [Phytohabitans flavus]
MIGRRSLDRLADMESWTGHEVPRLPGSGQPLALFDSARRAVHPTGGPSGARTIYVCGITPYDATHLGHAATMITFDLVQRAWLDAGHEVTYVQNVTDIDDPLLERAARDGEDWIVLGMRETALFREDMESLRMIPPAYYVGAVESIPAIVEKVATLVDRRAAYRLDDGTGDVYFDIAAAPDFGYESNLSREQMLAFFAERGGDPERAGKRDPSTRCCGAVPARVSRRGPAGSSGRGGRDGTSSAPRSRWTCSATPSTYRAAATTCSSRTTSARPRMPRRSRGRRRSPATTYTPG